MKVATGKKKIVLILEKQNLISFQVSNHDERIANKQPINTETVRYLNQKTIIYNSNLIISYQWNPHSEKH